MASKELYIITGQLVARLHEEGFPLSEPPTRYYPDGSLWTTDYEPSGRIIDMLNKEPGGCGRLLWRALEPFGDQLYVAQYPGWYNTLLARHGDSGVVSTPSLNPVSSEERNLRCIRVKVQLYRRFTEEIAMDLAGAVRRWFDGVGSKGVFGERGMSSISSNMLYLNRDASFEIDMCQSGQETLNTLILAILSWGISTRRPLYWIAVAADQYEPVLKATSSSPLRGS